MGEWHLENRYNFELYTFCVYPKLRVAIRITNLHWAAHVQSKKKRRCPKDSNIKQWKKESEQTKPKVAGSSYWRCKERVDNFR
jgi:hypothetical protein